jgi:hypothetical protein
MELSKLKVKELKSLAKSRGLKGYSKYKKDALINLLNNEEISKPCEVVSIKKQKDYDIKNSDIVLLFFSVCVGRENNDIYNDMREYILSHILSDKFKEYFDDSEYGSKWNLLKISWKECLDTLFTSTCKKEYDSINIIKKGGRKNNYDFNIEYLLNKKVIHTISNIEFKNGASSISGTPQFLNSPANKPFLLGYPEWFYDNYVCKEDPWTRFKDTRPSKEQYMKDIYKDKSKNKFFIKLKEEEKDKEYYKLKQVKTAESIKIWLNENYKNLNLKEVTKEFIRTQNGKIFILWDKDTFNIDTFDQPELSVKTIVGINRDNSILVNSESNKIQYKMLLRWKNQLGVLYPAWQISMKPL